MGFSRQGYWCGLPCPPSGDLPDPEMKLVSLTSNLHRQAGFCFVLFCFVLFCFTTSATWEAQQMAAQGKGQIVPMYFYCFILIFRNFPDQGSNPCPLKWKRGVLTLDHQESPSLYYQEYKFWPIRTFERVWRTPQLSMDHTLRTVATDE